MAEIITRKRTLVTIIKETSYNSIRNTIIIVVIMVLETTRAPQLNNILQFIQRCELAIGVGQGAAAFRIAA
jgi:hypothetical protein